jgi:23S rRNA pseudouridine955/2504/2580 synthase
VKRPFTAGVDDAGRRLESVIRRMLPHLALSAVHKALREGDIRLNGAKAGPEARVAEGDTIAVWDALVTEPPRERAVPPVPPEWVLHLGDDLAVLNKPAGLVTHRGDGRSTDPALDERVRAWLPSSGLAFRPGPLHRLDRETSGIVVFSRTLAGAHAFSQALRERQVSKTYLAVLTGTLEQTVRLSAALRRNNNSRTTLADEGGQESDTTLVPLAWSPGLTLAQVELGTGRTHQIRAHAQLAGHPLAGDRKYGGGAAPDGLDVPFLLHAWKLACALLPPVSAPLPAARARWLEIKFKFSL